MGAGGFGRAGFGFGIVAGRFAGLVVVGGCGGFPPLPAGLGSSFGGSDGLAAVSRA